MVLFVLGTSIIIQFASAFIALRLTKLTKHYTAWLLIASAIILMGVRRIYSFISLVQERDDISDQLIAELIALAISLLLLTGLIKFSSFFIKAQTIQDQLNSSNKKLIIEAEARRSSENSLSQFKATLDQVHDCVFMFSPESLLFTYVNQGAIAQLGYSREEMYQIRPPDIKPDYDEESFRALIEPLMSEETKSLSFETIHQHKEGRLIPVSIFLQYTITIYDAPCFIAIVKDVTEQKKIEANLKSSNNELERFIYKVSHDLRGPLTTIKGLLNLASIEIKDRLASQYFDLINTTSIRLSGTLDDLSEAIRIKQRQPKIVTVDFDALVGQLIAQYPHGKELNKVNIVRQNLTENEFKSDESLVTVILKNLIYNAIQYGTNGSKKGQITLTFKPYKEGVMISVKDEGVGIHKNEQKKIFDLFYRASYNSIGSGMGLYLVKNSVDKLSGTILLKSKELQGSEFIVWLPNN
jgi:PAS domain S-box-containing protein